MPELKGPPWPPHVFYGFTEVYREWPGSEAINKMFAELRLLAEKYIPAEVTVGERSKRGGRATEYRTTFLAAIDWGLKLAPRDRPQSVADRGAELLKASKPNRVSGSLA